MHKTLNPSQTTFNRPYYIKTILRHFKYLIDSRSHCHFHTVTDYSVGVLTLQVHPQSVVPEACFAAQRLHFSTS